MVALPASLLYSSDGAPAFRAFDDMAATAHGGDRVDAIAVHAEMRRVSEWAEPILPAPVIRPLHGREWLAPLRGRQGNPSALVRFPAHPAPSRLALFGPHPP